MKTVSAEKKDLKFTIPVILEVISPIHIGTREGSLRNTDFIIHKGKAYIIDENKFCAFLLTYNLIDDFVDSVSSGFRSIAEYLKGKNLKDMDKIIRSITLRSISIHGGENRMGNFRPFLRDARGQVFIPGTSIKGTLRTGFLHGILSSDSRLREEKESWVENNLWQLSSGNKEKAKKRFSYKILQEDILQNFRIPGTDQKDGPNRDILRCLTVRDAYPIGQVESRLIKLQFLSKNASGEVYWSKQKKTGWPLEIWVEAVIAGKFMTELIWDTALFDHFKAEDWYIKDLNGLLHNAWNMNKDIFDHEKKHFSVNSKPKDADARYAAQGLYTWYEKQQGSFLRIGFGSGMLSTTVDGVLSPGVRTEIRNICGHNRGNDPAPKTRRVWEKEHNQWVPMGWMRFSQPEDNPTIAVQKKEPEPVVEESWEKATLEWRAQDATVLARSENRRAFGKGKELIPASMHDRLIIKRKNVTAKITVVQKGNSFMIVKIEPFMGGGI